MYAIIQAWKKKKKSTVNIVVKGDNGQVKYKYTTELFDINPNKILISQISAGEMIDYQKNMSKAVWRPAPGRKLGFLVTHEEHLLGLIFLASPVINLTVRDAYLDIYKKPNKGKLLRQYMDISVCVGAQPISWHWNLGKLCALLAATLGDFIEKRYTEDKFLGVITTSLYGKSKQYNRIYKFLGYTKGFGHEHISDEEYHKMLEWMKNNGIEIPSSKFGAGSNPRMRRIMAYRKASGDKSINVYHGLKRGVYYHEAIPSHLRQETIDAWYERWGHPRYLRTKDNQPPYQTGLE